MGWEGGGTGRWRDAPDSTKMPPLVSQLASTHQQPSPLPPTPPPSTRPSSSPLQGLAALLLHLPGLLRRPQAAAVCHPLLGLLCRHPVPPVPAHGQAGHHEPGRCVCVWGGGGGSPFLARGDSAVPCQCPPFLTKGGQPHAGGSHAAHPAHAHAMPATPRHTTSPPPQTSGRRPLGGAWGGAPCSSSAAPSTWPCHASSTWQAPASCRRGKRGGGGAASCSCGRRQLRAVPASTIQAATRPACPHVPCPAPHCRRGCSTPPACACLGSASSLGQWCWGWCRCSAWGPTQR